MRTRPLTGEKDDRVAARVRTVANPVMQGMYPDPSWIWDETRGEIVLVNSSFELVPGLPIHVTRDLTSWEHVGDAVDAAMARRLLIDGVEDSGGLYAPTIRRIRGRYAIVCTVARVNEERALAAGCSPADIEDCRAAQGNFVITADTLEGPWQGPYWVADAEGIDPDIFEDNDGAVWWTQTRPAVKPQWEGQTEVWAQPIDPSDWTLQGHKTVIWRGYGLDAVWAEGPHMYRMGDWVYLMTAEGGTSFEHSEMMMRTYAPQGFAAAIAGFEQGIAARDVWIEPAREGAHSVVGQYDRLFQACKRNPMLTHRHLGNSELIQCVGHADLLRHPQAGWLLACLGVRETPGREPGELFSYLGRETFVAPVAWERNPVSWKLAGDGPAKQDDTADPGWPVVAPGLGRLPAALAVSLDDDGALRSVESVEVPLNCLADDGYAERIDEQDDRLIGVRGRDGYRFMRVDAPDYAAMVPPNRELMLHQDSTHYVTMRVKQGGLTAEITDRGETSLLDLGTIEPGEWFGMRLYDNRLRFLAVRPVACDVAHPSSAKTEDEDDAEVVAAAVGSSPCETVLMAHADISGARTLGECDARFLSTEWAGGFVGCLVGSRTISSGAYS
ncbi:glycoside hydrolase family 43 protein [Bifidobacterium callitrichidarum]|uniref:Beta-xylosidase n=1 Tax=Bifidobacterium callitrichidarum TaxID=2052941 RepID=A0A2U2N692_9BIFI|nr:beta-xylosidase [Bifidobacterium callitrichidarum]